MQQELFSVSSEFHDDDGILIYVDYDYEEYVFPLRDLLAEEMDIRIFDEDYQNCYMIADELSALAGKFRDRGELMEDGNRRIERQYNMDLGDLD